VNFAYAGASEVSQGSYVLSQKILPLIETKDYSCNVQGNVLGNSCYIAVECPSHIVVVAEHKCLLGVKPDSNDILRIAPGVFRNILNCTLFRENVLLIIRKHDCEGHIEYIL